MLYLFASAHCELYEGTDVIKNQVHQPEFVGKAHQDEEASGMQSYTVCLLLELLVQLQLPSDNLQRTAQMHVHYVTRLKG